MKKFVKFFSAFAGIFAGVATGASKCVEFFDRLVHYRERRAAEKRAKVIRTILLVLGGVLLVLLIPYKVRIEKNGDYEIRTLALKLSRKTKPNDTEADFELGLDDVDVDNVEVVEA